MSAVSRVLCCSVAGAVLLALQLHAGPTPFFPHSALRCSLQHWQGATYSPYEVVNPYYLRFHGMGDPKISCAMLVRESTTKQVVILLYTENECRKWKVRNEGTDRFNGVDDFSWISDWDVLSTKEVNDWLTGAGKSRKGKGEGLMLTAGEKGGLLLYWTGTDWALDASDA